MAGTIKAWRGADWLDTQIKPSGYGSESSDETDLESVCSVVPNIESYEIKESEIEVFPWLLDFFVLLICKFSFAIDWVKKLISWKTDHDSAQNAQNNCS